MSHTTTLEGPGAIFVSPEAYADPDAWHRTAAYLRRESPVHLVDVPGYRPFWAITRHADIMAIERRADVFVNGYASTLLDDATMVALEELGPALRTLVDMDGQTHRDHRGATADWFLPSAIRRLTDRISSLADATIASMIERGDSCDFVNDVAMHYPLRVIMQILGVPEADEAQMLRLTQEIFGAKDPEYSRGANVDDVVAVIKDFFRYFWKIVEARRADPADDLATVIASAMINGQPMGSFETISYFVLVATAGHDTTATAISGGLDALLGDSAQLERLQNEPELLPIAVDEMIRWVSPVKHFMRTAQADAEINGHQFHAGDWLLLSYASANRDEAVFTDPFAFDVARPNAKEHLAFGFGPHFCLGAHLARLEMRELFRALFERVESVERAAPTRYMRTTFVGGPKSLPIRFRARSFAPGAAAG
jgi:cytochrome P450